MIKVCHDEEAVAQSAAEIFVEQFRLSMLRSDKMSVVLSGGQTPMRTYQRLADAALQCQVDWSRVHIFWGDERCVPITDARSNYKMAQQAFLSQVPIPAGHIHPILCTQHPQLAAQDYEAGLKSYFKNAPARFDLVFLGLGEDGHTASLFSQTEALNEKVRWVKALQKPTEDFARITLTLPLLNLTQLAVFLVTGADKAQILKKVLAGSEDAKPVAAQLIRPVDGRLLWLVDSAAYENLSDFEAVVAASVPKSDFAYFRED